MKTLLKYAFAVALVAVTARADKPDFSGDWSLNVDKSNLGPMPPPTSMTRKVEHKDPNLSLTQITVGGPQGDQTVNMKMTTDGKEVTNEMMGTQAKTTATWEGNALVINWKVEFGGTEIKLTQKWSL